MYRMSTYQEFETWKASIEKNIANLLNTLPVNLQDKLDYSLDSLEVLEQWLLERYPEPNRYEALNEYLVIDGAGSYVGEVFRNYLGGNWTIDLEDQEYAFLGIAGIKDYKSNSRIVEVYPIIWVTTSIHRRIGNFIRTRVEQYLSS